MAEALLCPLRAARQAPPLHEANFALVISRACSPVLQPLRLHRQQLLGRAKGDGQQVAGQGWHHAGSRGLHPRPGQLQPAGAQRAACQIPACVSRHVAWPPPRWQLLSAPACATREWWGAGGCGLHTSPGEGTVGQCVSSCPCLSGFASPDCEQTASPQSFPATHSALWHTWRSPPNASARAVLWPERHVP